jgi:hypothetical protein
MRPNARSLGVVGLYYLPAIGSLSRQGAIPDKRKLSTGLGTLLVTDPESGHVRALRVPSPCAHDGARLIELPLSENCRVLDIK